MRYLIAFLCPPLAVLLCGKPFQALLCIPVSIFYFPGVLWALLVVSSHKADVRNAKLIRAADRNAKAQVRAIEAQTRAMQRALYDSQQAQVIDVQVAAPLPSAPRPAALQPPAAPGPPAPAPAASPAPAPVPPKPPLVTFQDLKAFAARAREGAVYAYQNLPEWAQPVTWGLAAATPISLILMILFTRR